MDIAPAMEDGLRVATAGMHRRGPDDEGFWSSGLCALGHRRLAIVDTGARSNQPMTSPDGRYALVYNGEIYNHPALRAAMVAEGDSFATESDTEVLLRGLMRRGREFLSEINGFFAFAFYDKAKHELLVARDRFGIKPLYHVQREGRFSFSSTLQGLMDMGHPREVDRQSLSTYLQLSYVPAPMTMLRGAHKLLPGHCATVSAQGVEMRAYYELPAPPREYTTDKKRATKELRTLVSDAVRMRLMADVPLGCFLSGGLDSAIIALLAGREKPDMPTFSVGFPDHPYFDESKRAAATARHLGLEHHVLEVRESDLETRPERFLDAFDEPFADSSSVLVNLLSEYAAQRVKVALSGDGSDEIFGGYNKHRALLRSVGKGALNEGIRHGNGLLQRLPTSRNHGVYNRLRKLKRYGRGLRLPFAERYWEWACFTPAGEVAELLTGGMPARPAFLDALLEGLSSEDMNSVLRADMQLVLPNDMLYKTDRMSMRHSLEVRTPFLDHRSVEFAFSLPWTFKTDGRTGKQILRDAFAQDFPDGHFAGGKRGFEAPLTHWFRGPLAGLAESLLDEKVLREGGYFDPRAVSALRAKAVSRAPGDAPHTLWAVLVFQYWHEKYIRPSL